MPEFDEFPADGAKPPGPSVRRGKRGRRRRRLVAAVLLGIFAVLLPWLNGPGFRLLARHGGLAAARSQGLTGDFRVSGSLWSGFALHDLRLEEIMAAGTGAELARSVRAEELSVSYRALDLIRGPGRLDWLDAVRLGRTEIRWSLPEPSSEPEQEKEEKPEKPGPSREPDAFGTFWNLLATEYAIDDLTLSLRQGDRVWSLESLRLSLPGGGAEGSLRIARLSLPGAEPLEDLAAVLRPGERSLELGPLPLLGYGDLESLSLAEARPGEFSAEARVAAAGGRLDLSAILSPTGALAASLGLARQSDLSLEALPLPGEAKLRGRVSDLSLEFAGEPLRPASWDLRGKVVASGLGWGGEALDSAMLLVEGGKLELEALAGKASLRFAAEADLAGAETLASLGTLSAEAQAEATVPDLGETLGAFGLRLPLSGAASLEAKDLRLDRGGLETGGLLLSGDALAWDGVALDEAALAVHVEQTNFLRLALDLALDESSRAHLAGTVDLEARRYEAGAEAAIETAGRFDELLAALGREGLVAGGASLSWKGQGPLGPGEHGGAVSVALSEFSVGRGEALEGSLAADYGEGGARLERLALKAGETSLSGTGEWDGARLLLPDFAVRSGDSRVLALSASLPLGRGGGEGEGPLDRDAPLELTLSCEGLEPAGLARLFSDAELPPGRLDGRIEAGGSLAALDLGGRLEFRTALRAEEGGPEALASCEFSLAGDSFVPSTWRTALAAKLSGLSWKGVALETLSLEAATEAEEAGRPLVARLRFEQSGALLEAAARLGIGEARSLGELAGTAIEADASVEIADAAALVRDLAPSEWKGLPLGGGLSASLEGLRLERGSLRSGSFSLRSDTLSFGGETFETLDLAGRIDEPDRIGLRTEIALDALSGLEGDGLVALAEQRYSGKLALRADLVGKGSRLGRMLSGRPLAELLPGRSELDWAGQGSLAVSGHEGRLSLEAGRLRLAAGAEPLDFTVAGSYAADGADFPKIELRSAPLELSGSARWADRELTLLASGRTKGREVLALDARLPLGAKTLSTAGWFAQEETMSLGLDLKALPLAEVLSLVTEKAPIVGELSLDLAASGRPAAPSVRADLGLENLAVPREGAPLEAGRIGLELRTGEKGLSLSGEYRHPEVKPLAIVAALPFHPGEWASGTRRIGEERIEASAKMERSPLGFLAGQVPGIESVDGEIELDAAVSGSIGAPEIRGMGHLDVSRLRLESRLAPSLRDIDLVVRFGENRVLLERLFAVVAGGTVEGEGEAAFAPGEEPRLRLALKGGEVLVYRNPDVNVRTDLDLRLEGPWSEAALSGEIGLVNSRYFRNFDLLPVGLPTRRPASALPTVQRSPRGGGAAYEDLELGLDLAPFRDWPLSLRLHTKDPFLVRSNLLESAITADLRLGGTLGRPSPVGRVSIREGEMRLPFSRIDVETGRIEFDEATGFNGALEFKARAKADKYQIAIYLYDRILSPQYVLSSIPPLPSEDIITLIATGTVRSDLVGEDVGSLAASKAAGLLLSNLRQKSNRVDGEPTLLDLIEERTEFELGRVNPETGQQTFGGKVRLWKQLFFVGNVDAGRDYRAVLKYVFRLD